MEPIVVTPKEAAEILRLSEVSIFKLIREGRIASIKLGRSRRIPLEALKRLVELGEGE